MGLVASQFFLILVLKVEGKSTKELKKEKKMKNLEIDFLNDDIFEIESLIDNMNLPEEPISGVGYGGREWKSTLRRYVYGTIDKVQQFEYEVENLLYDTEEFFGGEEFTQDEIEETLAAYEKSNEEERRELERVLTNYFSK